MFCGRAVSPNCTCEQASTVHPFSPFSPFSPSNLFSPFNPFGTGCQLGTEFGSNECVNDFSMSFTLFLSEPRTTKSVRDLSAMFNSLCSGVQRFGTVFQGLRGYWSAMWMRCRQHDGGMRGFFGRRCFQVDAHDRRSTSIASVHPTTFVGGDMSSARGSACARQHTVVSQTGACRCRELHSSGGGCGTLTQSQGTTECCPEIGARRW